MFSLLALFTFLSLLVEVSVTILDCQIIYLMTYLHISGVTGDRVGLAITQSLSLVGLLQWAVRQS